MCDQEEPLCVGGASCSDGPFISLGWEFGKRIDWKLREMGSSLSPSEPGKRYLRTSPYIVVFSTAPSAWVRLSPALHTDPWNWSPVGPGRYPSFMHGLVKKWKKGEALNPIKLFLLCPRESTFGEEWVPYSAIYHFFSFLLDLLLGLTFFSMLLVASWFRRCIRHHSWG